MKTFHDDEAVVVGYGPGQGNFGAIQGWNSASVYQKAIAIMGKKIGGN